MPKGYPGSDTHIILVCQHCGKEFRVRAYRKDTAKYCSRKCLRLGTEDNKNVEKTCLICGKAFYVPILRQHTAKYCSRACYYKSMAHIGSVEIRCPICGKTFLQSPSHNQTCCSRKCAGILERLEPSASASGIRSKIAGMKLNERCCMCGYHKYPQILEVHHIDHNRKNNHWSNLTLLCPNCHKSHHFVQPILIVPTIEDLMREVGLQPIGLES